MLDAALRRVIDPPLDRIGRALATWGVNADAVTVAGFAIGVAAWAALATEAYAWAAGLILLNRAADGLDGAVARHRGMTDLGGYLDVVLDFIFYAGVPFFFAVGRPQEALAAGFLTFSFMGTSASFLAFAAIAARRGLTSSARGRKVIYYVGGLTEGTETIVFFVMICAFAGWFAALAWIFGALCWLTTASRIAVAVLAFGRPQPTGD